MSVDPRTIAIGRCYARLGEVRRVIDITANGDVIFLNRTRTDTGAPVIGPYHQTKTSFANEVDREIPCPKSFYLSPGTALPFPPWRLPGGPWSPAFGLPSDLGHIALALMKAGQRVATIDLDSRQRSLTHYVETRGACGRRTGLDLELPVHFAVARAKGARLDQNEIAEFVRQGRSLAAGGELDDMGKGNIAVRPQGYRPY
jgi:ATPase MipZ